MACNEFVSLLCKSLARGAFPPFFIPLPEKFLMMYHVLNYLYHHMRVSKLSRPGKAPIGLFWEKRLKVLRIQLVSAWSFQNKGGWYGTDLNYNFWCESKICCWGALSCFGLSDKLLVNEVLCSTETNGDAADAWCSCCDWMMQLSKLLNCEILIINENQKVTCDWVNVNCQGSAFWLGVSKNNPHKVSPYFIGYKWDVQSVNVLHAENSNIQHGQRCFQ